MNWRDYFAAIGPPWTQRYWGERLWGAFAYMSDLVTEGMAQAIKAHLLEQATSPPDALPRIGNERRMPRYAGESDDQYRDRLLDAWYAYERGGTRVGVISQLAWYDIVANIVSFHDGWLFENPPLIYHWSRFAVFLTTHPWSTAYLYGAGYSYGTPITYGSTATPAEVDTVKGLIRKWKPVPSENPWIYVPIGGACYGDPSITYGGGTLYGGSVAAWANDS
jgi:hypothetical protein